MGVVTKTAKFFHSWKEIEHRVCADEKPELVCTDHYQFWTALSVTLHEVCQNLTSSRITIWCSSGVDSPLPFL